MPRHHHHHHHHHHYLRDSGDVVELSDLAKDDYVGDSAQDADMRAIPSRPRSSSESSSLQSFELYTPDEERKVVRKLDLHVVTFMSFLYLLSFLDRSNIGNAKIAGLSTDLQLSDSQFEWLLTAFYITYISFEWMILLYHYLTPHVYISLCVLAWGLLASLQSVSTSFVSLLILRLLLGLSEAAFSPGVPFYLSFFYRREELALRAGMQVSAAPLAASFAGSLAWCITRLGRDGPLAPWRLLFLVEGFPSVLIALVAWNVIADGPEKAGFLSGRERKIAQIRLGDSKSLSKSRFTITDDVRVLKKKRVDWTSIFDTVRDPKCYLTALMFLNCNISFSSMPVFLPTIINEMGHTSLTSQAMSAPPYLLSFVVVIFTARLSDRARTRSPFVIFHALLASGAYLLLSLSATLSIPNILRYVLVYPACCGFFSAITIIITWTMNNQASQEGKGVGMTILNLIGQCGPLLGTRVFPDEEGPLYARGMGVCAIAMAGVAVLAAILRWILRRENLRNETAAKVASTEAGEEEAAPLSGHVTESTNMDGKHIGKRFVLML